MKTRVIVIIFISFFIIISLVNIIIIKTYFPHKNKKNRIVSTTATYNIAPKSKETTSSDVHLTEIMPLWPPTEKYNKEILDIKKRNYITTTGKLAFLTIDDGPSPNTPKILSILSAKGVKATFFDVGIKVKAYPEFLKMEFNEGHAIGNHSWDHVYANLYKSPEALLDEATKTNELLEKVIGIRTPLFRAPGGTLGNLSIASWNIMDANNYIIYDWNVSSGDGSPVYLPKQKLVENVLTQSKNKETAFILLHDSPAKNSSVEALPEIIDGLRKEGFTFSILSPDIKPPQFIRNQPIPKNPVK